MKVFIFCEYTGAVLEAFLAEGHDAYSADLLPTESVHKDRHYQGDGRWLLREPWDLMIAFPPCTHLCVSGARWWKGKEREQIEALWFVFALLNAPIPRIAVENPIGKISTAIRKPDQIIQPWMFGHGETKATCLWLEGLPRLEHTDVVDGRDSRIHRMPPSPERGKNRSRTYPGIAAAMARQWGNYH